MTERFGVDPAGAAHRSAGRRGGHLPRHRRIRRSVGVLIAGALGIGVMAGCGESEPPDIDYVVDARIIGYNANTVDGNAAGTLMTTTRVLPGFSYLGAAGQVTPDRDIGTVAPVPGPSLTLRYEFHPEAVYSDGEALDCDDLVLAWAAMSGRYGGFTPATRAGYRDIENVDCTAGERVATVSFAKGRGYRDWPSLFGAGTMLPAHVVSRDSGTDVLAAIRAGDKKAIGAVAKVWNTGFDITPGPIDETRFPASGPYRFDSYTVEDGLVLTANPKWWGDAPATGRITIHGRDTDPERLADGDFDIVDISAGLTAAEPTPRGSGESTESGSDVTTAGVSGTRALGVEELVPTTKGAFADARVRRAFAACVPRDVLARDHGQGAPVWNLRTLAPADSLAGQINGEFGGRYARADLPYARDLLAQAAADGVSGIGGGERDRASVRIGYLAPSERHRAMVEIIKTSCAGAGLKVTDVSAPDLRPSSLGRDVDVMLASQGTSSAASGAADPARDSHRLHGQDPLDVGGFQRPAVTGAIDELSVTHTATDRLRLTRTVERTAWAEMASIPLFAAPRVQRASSGVDNVVIGTARNGTGWNMDRWTVTEQ